MTNQFVATYQCWGCRTAFLSLPREGLDFPTQHLRYCEPCKKTTAYHFGYSSIVGSSTKLDEFRGRFTSSGLDVDVDVWTS